MIATTYTIDASSDDTTLTCPRCDILRIARWLRVGLGYLKCTKQDEEVHGIWSFGGRVEMKTNSRSRGLLRVQTAEIMSRDSQYIYGHKTLAQPGIVMAAV